MNTASTPADSGEHPVLQRISTAGKRLFWRLNGPLEDGAIQVAPSEYYEPGDVMEPYFGPDGSPHAAVSQASLMEPPVSSLTVRVACLDDWEQLWAEYHRDCATDPDPRYPDWRRLGPRPDDEAFEPRLYVLACCGQERPWAYDTCLHVAAEGEFLTVHEYVSAVHPWLMAMRDTILDALGGLDSRANWPPETKLAVLELWPRMLRIDREDQWARCHRRPAPPAL